MFILIHLYIIILIEYIILSLENNFLFESIIMNFVILFAVIENSLFHVILTRNNLNHLIHLNKNLRLRLIINLKINKYYYLKEFEKIYKLIIKLYK